MKIDVTDKDYELLSGYLDGELEPEQLSALQARLLSEPPLRSACDRLAAVDKRLRDAFDVPGADSVPAHVTQMVQAAQTRGRGVGRRVGWALGVAASVLFATGVLLNSHRQDQSDPQFAAQDALVAPVLERALSRGEGWEQLPGGVRVRPLLSFPSVDGSWCREYLLAQRGREWRGVACRAAVGRWETAVLAPEQAGASKPAYRPAGAVSSGQVETFVDSRAADIPLSREQEAALIARGWE